MTSPLKFRLLLTLFTLGSLLPALRANDQLFHSAPAAAATVDFDGKGFIIRGKREFIASGSIHFPRVPRELWKDRLLKLKRAGFNTVQTYVFWNYNETEQGKIDFTTGAHDLGAFLQTAQDVGLYATVRVGPYVCAEWDSGGYPVWLRNVPGVRVRADDPPFMDAVDKFFDQVFPIVAAHQINRGGNVILVQLENEDPEGWGTERPNSYFTHLQKKALDGGIEVPYFFSGLHHGTDTGGSKPWDSANRTCPWFSTETWVRWYDAYGNSDPSRLAGYERNVWNIIANGGNGFNLYMFHGGSNFDYFNDTDTAASYDYGTLVGQAGDLRNLYYGVKRATTFATSFPDILENSGNSTSTYANFASGENVTKGNSSTPAIKPYARTSPAGTAVFVRNTQDKPETATLQGGQTLDLDRREVAPILVDTTLAPGIRVKLGAARTLGLATHGATTTWIVYGKPEEKGHIDLDLDQPATIAGTSASALQVQMADPKHPSLDLAFSEDAPQQVVLTSGGQTLRILVETVAWTDHTWLTGERGAQTVVTGPDYVGDFDETDGKAQLTVARAFGDPALKEVTLYGEAPEPRNVAVTDPVPSDDDSAPALGTWEMAKASAPAAPDFADSGWMSGDPAPQLGADGDPTAYGWYRATFNAPTAGQGQLTGKFVNNAVVFLNGSLAGSAKAETTVPLSVKMGVNTLAVFVSHSGRQKGYGYVGKPLDTYYPKGILGPVNVSVEGQQIAVTGWKLHGGISAIDAPDLKWEPVASADLGTPAFFRTQFTAKVPTDNSPCPIYRISTTGLSRGSVFINGHNVGRYPEKIKIDGAYLPECWLKDGQNSLVIFDEEGHVPTSSVHLWCERVASREVFPVHEDAAKTPAQADSH
jgi:beta-galactosidase